MQKDTHGTPAVLDGQKLSIEPVQHRPESECELTQRKTSTRSRANKRAVTKLIAPDALGLSDNDFKNLIAGWIVPRLIEEFAASQMNSRHEKPAAHHENAAQELNSAA